LAREKSEEGKRGKERGMGRKRIDKGGGVGIEKR
jgi:hypothetical protein